VILDRLENASRYEALHPAFARAFQHLKAAALGLLAVGRHPVDGDRLYISVDQAEGRGRDGARLEAHRKYIDIQLGLRGHEEIGWKPLAECSQRGTAFDDSRDIGFFDDTATVWLPLPPGVFAIFFPSDAHAPLAGSGAIRKAIAKVQV
jgi:YhcH/YjgK/YiaL family protein